VAARLIRVFAADRQPVFRAGLLEAIKERSSELELVGTASDGRTALEEIKRLMPDVAVLDMELADLDGGRVMNAITRDDVSTRVLFLSAPVDGSAIYHALARGAAGFLTKDADKREICDAILAVSRGETILSPEIQARVAAEIRMRGDDEPLLTPREREILPLVAKGLSAAAIGRQLHLSSATVKTHLQHLYKKLGVSDRAAAVAEAMRRGYLE
jgi:two-component system nitrate/nitrite response regulator NarL